MKCHKCNAEISSEETFCTECGEKQAFATLPPCSPNQIKAATAPCPHCGYAIVSSICLKECPKCRKTLIAVKTACTLCGSVVIGSDGKCVKCGTQMFDATVQARSSAIDFGQQPSIPPAKPIQTAADTEHGPQTSSNQKTPPLPKPPRCVQCNAAITAENEFCEECGTKQPEAMATSHRVVAIPHPVSGPAAKQTMPPPMPPQSAALPTSGRIPNVAQAPQSTSQPPQSPLPVSPPFQRRQPNWYENDWVKQGGIAVGMLILVGFISAVVVVMVGRPKAGSGSQATYSAPQADIQQSSAATQPTQSNGSAMPPGMEQFSANEQDARASLISSMGNDSAYQSAWQTLYDNACPQTDIPVIIQKVASCLTDCSVGFDRLFPVAVQLYIRSGCDKDLAMVRMRKITDIQTKYPEVNFVATALSAASGQPFQAQLDSQRMNIALMENTGLEHTNAVADAICGLALPWSDRDKIALEAARQRNLSIQADLVRQGYPGETR